MLLVCNSGLLRLLHPKSRPRYSLKVSLFVFFLLLDGVLVAPVFLEKSGCS